MKERRAIWGYDQRWLRVEPLDDHGESLGLVHFEPTADHLQVHRPRLSRYQLYAIGTLLATLAALVSVAAASFR